MRRASLTPLWGARGAGGAGGGVFPLRGRGPYAAGWEGNTRGDKFGVLERGVEQDLITRGTGAAPFVAGILPADRQERSSRPPQEEHPTPLVPVTTTFTAPERPYFKLRYRTRADRARTETLREVSDRIERSLNFGRALTAREWRLFAKVSDPSDR